MAFRQVIIAIPESDILALMTGERRLILPNGAKLISTWGEFDVDEFTEVTNRTLCLRLEHDSFSELVRGRIPRVAPQFERGARKRAAADCPCRKAGAA